MSVGLPSRGWSGPRAGTFAPHRRSPLNRAFAKGGVARSWDWLLIAATCALTADPESAGVTRASEVSP